MNSFRKTSLSTSAFLTISLISAKSLSLRSESQLAANSFLLTSKQRKRRFGAPMGGRIDSGNKK